MMEAIFPSHPPVSPSRELSMHTGSWLSLLQRQLPPEAPLDWSDLVVGYDFGLLTPAEVQAWVRENGPETPACRSLAGLEGGALEGFEPCLWEACAEATGRVPRPGGRRWAHAQDRWRLALLRDALEAPLAPAALAVAVERIYEQVGCPEDMLGLWPFRSRAADPAAVRSWVQQRERALSAAL